MATATVLTAPVVLLDFMAHYFMNDLVTIGDHVGFVRWLGENVLILGLLFTAVTARRTTLPLARLAAGCLAAASLPTFIASTGYALMSLTPTLDPAIGGSLSNHTWLIVAAVFAAASLVAAMTARGSLRRIPR